MPEFKIIQQTVETRYGNYHYRFFTDNDGTTTVKRSVHDNDYVLWNHGVITEAICQGESRFVPMCRAGFARKWPTLDDAIQAIEEIVDFEFKNGT